MKRFKHSTLLAILAIFVSLSPTVTGQTDDAQPQSKREKVEQLKIAFITKELDLTTVEAEKFWPVYNEMSDKLKEQKKSRKTKSTELKDNFDTLSEEDIKKKATEILDSEITEAKLKKEYTEKIAEIIGYKKAVQLLNVEQRFKRELLNKLNQRQQGQGQGQRPQQGQRPSPPRPRAN